jgi:UPF0716 protein FxsA
VLLLLLILFIALPVAELYVIIEVGSLIGTVPTIALLLADSVLGAVLVRRQGRAAWRRLADAISQGRPPAREVIDGAFVMLGGALLIVPGFITDVIGLALLVPPSRALARRLVAGGALRRAMGRMPHGGRRRWNPPRPYDVEGTATETPGPLRGQLP